MLMARSGKTLPHFHTGRPVVVVALDHRCPRHRIVPFQGPVLCHQMIRPIKGTSQVAFVALGRLELAQNM